ncbi:MAG: phage DNA encapsidation protein, partial [Lentisphaeria bacterium]|nr:phage DNA encapsidation protein [Lentisphaeria bacterium]
MAKLYLPNGFLDYEKLEKLSSTLNIVLGPRNAGKTYGALLHFTGAGRPFIFLRTTKTQIDLVFSDELSPFNKLNRDLSTKYCVDKVDKSGLIAVFNDYEEEEGLRIPAGDRVGYCLALSQVGATRGFNLDEVEVLLYDEFIHHPGEVVRGANKQFVMYADIVFTLNRTRELEGRPPLRQWLFGNSDDLTNNILLELRIVNSIIKMKAAGENYLKLPDRDISIFLLDDSPAARRLGEKSALSKVFAGSSYLE